MMKLKKTIYKVLLAIMMAGTLAGCTSPQPETAAEQKDQETISTEAKEEQKAASPEEALQLLKEGNKRFVDNKQANNDLSETRRNELIEGQEPFAVVVACSDSRVAPEHAFDQGLGDIFVVRVAGNILDPAEIGSVEYAVDHLKSKVVVVLGHESCGAVTAAVEKDQNPEDSHTTEHIDAFLDNIEPAVAKAKEGDLEGKALVEKTAEINAELAAAQLLSDSSLIKSASEKNEVKVVSGKYLLTSGAVEWHK